MSTSDDTIRAALAVSTWIAFIGFAILIFLNGVPKGYEAVVSEHMTKLCLGVTLVTNYYFKRA